MRVEPPILKIIINEYMIHSVKYIRYFNLYHNH